MIVPTNRCIFWTAAVVLPCFLLAATVPLVSFWAWAVLGLWFLLAAADAAAGFSGLALLEVSLSPVARLSTRSWKDVEVHWVNGGNRNLLLSFGLDIPLPVQARTHSVQTRLARGFRNSTVPFEIRCPRQGAFHCGLVFLAILSFLGFWTIRTKREVDCDIRVYPNLKQESHRLGALFLNNQLGMHGARQLGKGREFDQVREYVPGDPYGDIHWKATAKRGAPVTKVFQIERTQQVYVILDSSRLAAREVHSDSSLEEEPGALILEKFTAAALVTGMAAQRQGDQFGVCAFAQSVREFVRAGTGQTHYGACRDVLYSLNPRLVNPDYRELFTFLATRVRRRALLLFLCCLDDPVLGESFVRHIDLLSRKHLVVALAPRLEMAKPVFSEDIKTSAVDLHRNLAGHYLWARQKENALALSKKGVGFVSLDSERMATQVVSHYLNVKKRQIL